MGKIRWKRWERKEKERQGRTGKGRKGQWKIGGPGKVGKNRER